MLSSLVGYAQSYWLDPSRIGPDRNRARVPHMAAPSRLRQTVPLVAPVHLPPSRIAARLSPGA